MKFRHKHPGCPYDGRQCAPVKPDPAVEPPSIGTPGASIKIHFDGEREPTWVAADQLEVVRS